MHDETADPINHRSIVRADDSQDSYRVMHQAEFGEARSPDPARLRHLAGTYCDRHRLMQEVNQFSLLRVVKTGRVADERREIHCDIHRQTVTESGRGIQRSAAA